MPTLSIGSIKTNNPKLSSAQLLQFIDAIQAIFEQRKNDLPTDLYILLNIMDDGRVHCCARQPEYSVTLDGWVEQHLMNVIQEITTN